MQTNAARRNERGVLIFVITILAFFEYDRFSNRK